MWCHSCLGCFQWRLYWCWSTSEQNRSHIPDPSLLWVFHCHHTCSTDQPLLEHTACEWNLIRITWQCELYILICAKNTHCTSVILSVIAIIYYINTFILLFTVDISFVVKISFVFIMHSDRNSHGHPYGKFCVGYIITMVSFNKNCNRQCRMACKHASLACDMLGSVILVGTQVSLCSCTFVFKYMNCMVLYYQVLHSCYTHS